MQEQPSATPEATAIVPAHLDGIVPVANAEPVRPADLSDEEAQELRARAQALVKDLEVASGSREMELVDSVTSMGTRTMRNAGSELDLLRGRVGAMMSNDGPGTSLTRDMVDLRMTLNQINPHELSRSNVVGRFLAAVPIVNKMTPALRVLERIAIRYESVSRQITVIENRLREGRMMLTRDNVELRKLYEQVEAQQSVVQKNAYLGELLVQELTDLMERTDDTLKAERLRNALHDVITRVQDLRTMEVVNTQFYAGIEMTRQNNNRLGQSVERTLSLATNVITIGLAIQTALERERRVKEATERTREFLGDMIAVNAETIKQHTTEIGELYNNPVIAIDKITQAHNALLEAMDIADRLKQQGIEQARVNIANLAQLSTEMNERMTGLREQAAEPESFEA